MIRYHEPTNTWISGKNPDDQGMPTTNLTGDTHLCGCYDCSMAFGFIAVKNGDEVRDMFHRGLVTLVA